MKYIIILVVFLSILACTNQDKYYTKRTVTASVTNKGEEKEVYRMTEIKKERKYFSLCFYLVEG